MSYVDWIDHHGNMGDSWASKNEIVSASEKDFIIRTWGEILYEDDDKIILAGEKRLDKDIMPPIYRYTTTVIKKLVLKVER